MAGRALDPMPARDPLAGLTVLSTPHPADRQRPCVRCFVVKAPKGFPTRGVPQPNKRKGRSARGVARVCWSCIEREAWMLLAAGFTPRSRDDFRRHGVVYRKCVECRATKPLVDGFYASGRARYRRCKDCMRAERAERNRRRMQDRGRKDAENARLREKRATDPAYREKANEASRRWRAKHRNDPAWLQRRREESRIQHRLKREREGVPLGDVRAIARVSRHEYVPVGPLLALFDRELAARQIVADAVNDPSYAAVGHLCEDLGVDERKVRAWGAGEFATVHVGLAETMMQAAGVGWSDVYSYDDHLGLYAEGGVLEGAAGAT